jgi:cytochrome c oxidase subunit IV
MSDPHGHGHHGADHTPHVTPYKVYFATWAALVVLTAITVGASYVNFGPANLVIAVVIATIKAAIVGALFMHLLHDNKMHSLILVSGGLFLIIFIAFTMFDTEYRGKADAVEGERPADITRPFEGTKSLAAMKAKWPGAAAPATSPGNPASHAGANPPGANTAAAASVGSPDHDHPPIPGSSAGAPSASGSTPEPRVTEPASSASAGASVTAPPNSSVPPPPSASIAPAPGGHKAPSDTKKNP